MYIPCLSTWSIAISIVFQWAITSFYKPQAEKELLFCARRLGSLFQQKAVLRMICALLQVRCLILLTSLDVLMHPTRWDWSKQYLHWIKIVYVVVLKCFEFLKALANFRTSRCLRVWNVSKFSISDSPAIFYRSIHLFYLFWSFAFISKMNPFSNRLNNSNCRFLKLTLMRKC